MGTFHDSKYVLAKRDHNCCSCLTPILVGDEYLRYAQGQRSRLSVCVSCSLQTKPSYIREAVNPKWDCKVVEERLAAAERI
jgi:hypothetical protein